MALARVQTKAEDQDLRSRATAAGVGELWLGAFDLDGEGQWIWLDSSPLWSGTSTGTATGDAHFAAGSPNGGNTKNCLRMTANGEWTDADCATTAGYVCERILP